MGRKQEKKAILKILQFNINMSNFIWNLHRIFNLYNFDIFYFVRIRHFLKKNNIKQKVASTLVTINQESPHCTCPLPSLEAAFQNYRSIISHFSYLYKNDHL